MITLRDYFASQALSGLTSGGYSLNHNTEEISEYAYKLADGMMKARGPQSVDEQREIIDLIAKVQGTTNEIDKTKKRKIHESIRTTGTKAGDQQSQGNKE